MDKFLEGIRNIFGGMAFVFGVAAFIFTWLGNDTDVIRYGFLGIQLLLMALIVQVAQGQDEDS